MSEAADQVRLALTILQTRTKLVPWRSQTTICLDPKAHRWNHVAFRAPGGHTFYMCCQCIADLMDAEESEVWVVKGASDE